MADLSVRVILLLCSFQRAGKKVLSEATEMYPRRITRPCKQKTDARIGIRVPLANSTRKNRGKNGGLCGGAPGRDAAAGPRRKDLTFTCPQYATQRATRAKLRAKNGRGVRHRSHLKQFKCAVGFFNDDVRQGTMRALRRLGL